MILVQMLSQGIRTAARAWRTTLLLWGVNILLALVVSALARSLWISVSNGSMMGERLLSGFDFTTVTEMLRKGNLLTPAIRSTTVWMVLVNLIVVTFLGGGLITSIRQERPALSVKNILSASGLYAGRMVRLLGLQLLVMTVLVGVGLIFAAWLVSSAAEAARSEMELISRIIPAAVIVVLLIYVAQTTCMYARVIVVRNDGRSVFRAFAQGVRIVGRRILVIAPFHILLYSLLGIMLWLHWVFDDQVLIESFGTGFLFFLVLQIVVAMRMFLRVWDYAAAMILVDHYFAVQALSSATPSKPEITLPTSVLLVDRERPVEPLSVKGLSPAGKRKRPTKRRTKTTVIPKRLPNKRGRR